MRPTIITIRVLPGDALMYRTALERAKCELPQMCNGPDSWPVAGVTCMRCRALRLLRQRMDEPGNDNQVEE